ncbi:cyclic pyranopterin monophosphate synthase [mine drainage metagenome]|uniref:GTP 3',8-cyclase n=1 Tax=mine drainage metagenome TaxID=410659 RepID=A0A1J5Q570_9ZZZZ
MDGFGRRKRDLRVSLTDRCNLRCNYCMPVEGLAWLPNDALLTDDEILRVVKVAVDHGITRIRLTGGEPLIRPSLIEIVRSIAKLKPRPEITLTTNGIGLAALAEPLAKAGLDRINVSLDTLNPERFLAITHRNRWNDVILGLAAAKATTLSPIKVNSVLLRGINDDEAPALLDWALKNDYALRFIEQMPLDPQHGWTREEMVSAEEIQRELEISHKLTAVGRRIRGSSPAEEFLIGDGPATVGIIGSVTRPFCADCDRLRLTADGQVLNCLFAREEDDLRAILRSGSADIDVQIAQVLFGSVAKKKAGHGIGEPGFQQPERPMSAIGG